MVGTNPAKPFFITPIIKLCSVALHRLYFTVGGILKEGFAGQVLAKASFGMTMT